MSWDRSPRPMMTTPMPGTCSRICGRFLTPRTERPDVGPCVVFVHGETPVGRAPRGAVAPHAGGLETGGTRRPGIAAGADRIAGFGDGADMRPDDAVHTHVEDL